MVCPQEAELWQAVCPLLLLQAAESPVMTELVETEVPALSPWCRSAGCWHFVALTPSQT